MKKGFTLVEVLLTIGLIAIIATIVIVAINPVRQFAQARNTERWSDVRAIHSATYQYFINNGQFPTGLDTSLRMIGTDGSGCDITCGSEVTQGSCLDLSSALVSLYLTAIPYDPQSGSLGKTYYAIKKTGTAGRRMIVVACNPELNEVIEVLQ